MSIRKDITYFHNSDNTGMCPEDNGRLCGVLDFIEEAIKVIEDAAESVIAPTYLRIAAKDLLAKLGEESR